MAIQVCGNNSTPFPTRKDWSHFIGFFLSTTNQCLELICLQYSMVVSMNETNLIIRSLLEDFQTAISKTNWKNSQNETLCLCSLKGLLSNNDRQEPWTTSRVQWGDKAKASWEKERVIMTVYVHRHGIQKPNKCRTIQSYNIKCIKDSDEAKMAQGAGKQQDANKDHSPTEGHASIIVCITLPPSDIIQVTDRARWASGEIWSLVPEASPNEWPLMSLTKPFRIYSALVDGFRRQGETRRPAPL